MYFDENNYELGIKHLSELELNDDHACLIFVAEASSHHIPEIRSALEPNNINYSGAVFNSIIADSELKTSGFIVSTVPVLMPPIALDLASLNASDKRIQQLNQHIMGSPYHPLVMIFSCNSAEQLANQNHLAAFLRGSLSNQATFIGGGAGFASLERTKSVFDKAGMYDNGAILTAIDRPSFAMAEVGWKPSGRSNIVTETNDDGTIIQSINNRKAVSWFTNEFKKLRRQEINEAEIHFASSLHLAYFSLTGGYIVRAVVGTTPDGGLVLGGTIPPGTTITLIDTKPQAADSQIKRVVNILENQVVSVESTFIVQCVTRPVIMGDSFSNQLKVIENSISDNHAPSPVGFLALGEFGVTERANHIDFLNVSVVLAVSE